MIKINLTILSFALSLVAVQAHAKPSKNVAQRNIAKKVCLKNQVAFNLDGVSHCLDIASPITDSEYQNLRYNRDISNTDSNPDFF